MVSLTYLTLLAAAALNVSALTLPWASPSRRQTSQACMTPEEATAMVGIYQQLIANYTDALCDRYCAPDIYDFSDSISTLASRPTGQPTVAGKAAFMASQRAVPPSPLVVASTPIASCDKIAVIWTAAFGQAQKSSRGITVLSLAKCAEDWQIRGIDVEFNSLAWLEDMGGSYSLPRELDFS